MKFLLPAVLALTLGACQTPRTFQQPGPDWRTHQGQLRHSDAHNALIGDVVIAHLPSHHFQLDYVAGPGFPLLRIRQDETSTRAEGVMVRGRWQGASDAVPPPKYRNLVLLREIFNQAAASPASGSRTLQSRTPGLWSAEVKAERGRMTALDVRFPSTGERFQFVFPLR